MFKCLSIWKKQEKTNNNNNNNNKFSSSVSFDSSITIQMGTLKVPVHVPSPEHDCKTLRDAFTGIGTDEKTVIRVLGHRNASQRQKIRETYTLLYNKLLIDDLHSELSGDFRTAVILWVYDPAERDARLANKALKSKKNNITNLQVIVEIACASTPDHLISVRKAYCSLFDRSLEEDIIENVTMPVQKVLVGLVSSYRYDKEVVDSGVAESEAAQLHEAIKKKKLDHDGVVWILSTRNIFQLRATFQSYKQHYGNTIDQDILNCGNGLLESLLKVVVWCIYCPEKHFAEVVRASIIGFGTDEDSLTRAIVTRAEIDLDKAKAEYVNMDKSGMEKAVIGDTSGDYKNFLLTLLGEGI